MHQARYDPRMFHQYNSGAASLPFNQATTDHTTNCRFGKLTPMPVSRKETSRPSSSVGNTLRRERVERVESRTETEEENRVRQKQQLNQFYQNIDQQKENQLRVDLESRKHHDTLLPNQKSPVPLNRYEDQDINGNQALFLNAGKKPDDCKMVARALFSFQAQNNRELSFKKAH